MRAGAWDYIAWPPEPGRLRRAVLDARRHLESDASAAAARIALNRQPGFDEILGHAPPLLAALDAAVRLSPASCPVLLSGESGTGRETLARAMHRSGGHPAATFTILTEPAAIRAFLDEGGVGTLYIPEAGALSLADQAALLDLVDGRAMRVMAATSLNLAGLAGRGLFRRDLYYRLSAARIELPPLRERLSDLPELIDGLVARLAAGRPVPEAGPDLLARLRRWHWPGNLDELTGVLERLLALSGASGRLDAADLPEALCRPPSLVETLRLELPAEGISLEGVERELLALALRRFNGNQTHAARYLGLTRKTLIYRMEKFGLRPAGSAAAKVA
jgi:two-component system NtrC family response regulator